MNVLEAFLSQKLNAKICLKKTIVDFLPEYEFENIVTNMKLHELNSVSYAYVPVPIN